MPGLPASLIAPRRPLPKVLSSMEPEPADRLDLLLIMPMAPSYTPPALAVAGLPKGSCPTAPAAALGELERNKAPFLALKAPLMMASELPVGLVLFLGLRRLAIQLVRVRSTHVAQFRRKLSRLLAKLLLMPKGPYGPSGGAHMSCTIFRGRFCRRKLSAEYISRGLSKPLQNQQGECHAMYCTSSSLLHTCYTCMALMVGLQPCWLIDVGGLQPLCNGLLQPR